MNVERAGGSAGAGDLLLNYRYQLLGDGEATLAMSPRLSVALPTGSAAKGRGAGGAGIQLELPASWVLSPRVVTHWNAGGSLTPSAQDASGHHATTTSLNLGQSIIVLAAPTLNLMLETSWIRDEAVSGPGSAAAAESFVISPGIRWAINRPSGLQIVPGLAVPIGLGPSRGTTSLVLYLSFEHPY